MWNTMSHEAPQRNLEEILASGPPTVWYAGYGRTDTGITGLNFSHEFNSIADGRVTTVYGNWAHNRASLLPGIPARRQQQLERILAATSSAVQSLTGFTPEAIAEKSSALLSAFEGKTEAPFPVYLVNPYEHYTEDPPIEWFVGIAKRKEGIKRVLFSDGFTSLENGELYRQLHEWQDTMNNNRIGKHQPEAKRQAAMEAILYAGHYVKTVTGYFPDGILARRSGLEETWKGQYEAPFEIEYID